MVSTRYAAMREIKIRFGQCWTKVFANTPIAALAELLAITQMKIRWNNTLQDCTGRKGFVEVYRTTH